MENFVSALGSNPQPFDLTFLAGASYPTILSSFLPPCLKPDLGQHDTPQMVIKGSQYPGGPFAIHQKTT